MTAHWGRAAALLAVERHADAVLDIERAVELRRDLGLLAYLHDMAPTVGAAYVAGGRGADAIVVLEEILREPATRVIVCFRAPAQEAQDHLTTATTMHREMDMRFWLEQAQADGSVTTKHRRPRTRQEVQPLP